MRRASTSADWLPQPSVTAWARYASAPAGAVLRWAKVVLSQSRRTSVAAFQALFDSMTWRRPARAVSRSSSVMSAARFFSYRADDADQRSTWPWIWWSVHTYTGTRIWTGG